LVNIPNPFNPVSLGQSSSGFLRQNSNPAIKNIQEIAKNILNPQRSNSMIIKPKVATPENPEAKPAFPTSNFQILLDQNAEKALSIGSRLGIQRQESSESMANISRTFSISSLPATPRADLLRCQSHVVTDRSNAFKSYAKPLVLNSSNQIN
jgi:hypothetical protein